MGGRWPHSSVLCGVASRTCSIQFAVFLCNCRQAFSPYVLLASIWCIHIAVSTRLLLGKKLRFYSAIILWRQTQNIYSVEGEATVDHNTVSRCFKKFCLGYKNLDDQARSGRPKTIDSKIVLQTIEANSISCTWSVSGELRILKSSVICPFHDLGKNIQSCQIVPHITHGYRRWKWTRRHEFKSWTRLIAFHIALIPLGKVWIQLFSLQLWVNSRVDEVLQPW